MTVRIDATTPVPEPPLRGNQPQPLPVKQALREKVHDFVQSHEQQIQAHPQLFREKSHDVIQTDQEKVQDFKQARREQIQDYVAAYKSNQPVPSPEAALLNKTA